jgi:nucleotide-binding universal stress UspA family protein
MRMSGCVLVGYDGSESARAALVYGAARAGADGRLIVAHAVTPPTAFIDTPYFEQSLAHARERSEALADEAKEVLGGVDAELRLLEGPPARTLVALAQEVGADEIVVGSRGFGAVRAALGSVSHALLHETDRPVVLLTERAAARLARRAARDGGAGGAVTVAGYDGSDSAREALRYALRRSSGPVDVVYAYDAPASYLGRPYYGEALTASQGRGRELLDELKADPELASRIEVDLAEGPPAEALARAALVRDATEIVVGSRGLGRFRGAFGSVSHALVHEADRPVVVVPGGAAEDEGEG